MKQRLQITNLEKVIRCIELGYFFILLCGSGYTTVRFLKETNTILMVIAVLVVVGGVYIAGSIGTTLWTKTSHMFNLSPKPWMIIFQVLMWPSGLRVIFKIE